MDKRRYVSRDPNRPQDPKGMDGEESGNAAADGYSVRHREPLRKDRSDRYAYGGERCFHSRGLRDENEASQSTFGGYVDE